jgi:hypothetical protein
VKEKAERDEEEVPNQVCTKVRDAGHSAFSLPGTKDALGIAHVLAVVTEQQARAAECVTA